ncbi:MAG: hypothetical protein U5R31_11550 [Acidimicrobiia bacterium]|nr:hypothetical protein [Acidimicrobiia bacterium]
MAAGAAAAVAVAVLVLSSGAPAAAADGDGPCFRWSGQIPLQQAVRTHTCVEMAPGRWVLDRYLILPAGHTLRGDPSAPRAAIRLEAGPGWINTQGDGVVNDDGTGGEVARVEHFLIDGNNIATGGIGARKIHIEDMAIEEGSCSGVAIAGEGSPSSRNWIRANGRNPSCFGPPGAGIYAVTQEPNSAPAYYAPTVSRELHPGKQRTGPRPRRRLVR